MNLSFSVHGLKTGLITPGDDIGEQIIRAAISGETRILDGDIIAVAESAVATAEGAIVRLDTVNPSPRAMNLAERYQMDPAVAEVVLGESDEIIGGIPGFLLCIRQGHLLPNAGVDGSNAPEGEVTLLPRDPDRSARATRETIRACTGKETGVLVIDSRTHPMRYGCTAIAIGCSGFPAIIDERGRSDLFGKELKVTRRALADSIASAAELVMGEADEGVPAVIIRGLGVAMTDDEGIEQISSDECLFMGSMKAHIRKNEQP